MALSSGSWPPPPHAAPPPGPSPPSVLPGCEASQPGCSTVLMSVKVSVCHSGVRPLCLPGTGAADEAVRLQLSMDPGKVGEFRLALRACGGAAAPRSVTIAEFDLRAVRYETKTSQSHELSLIAPPHDRITFNFRSKQEAQAWATVVMSSLREAHRVATGSPAEDGQLPPQPLAAHNPALLPSTEELCQELVRAVEAGDVQAASACAQSLARLQTALSIQPSQKHYTDTEISLAVVVEDASSSCCVTVKVFPHTLVAALKQQVFLEYGFHPRVQRWVIGQCLCADSRSLASYGVQRDGDTAFLYLVSARQAGLSRTLVQQDQENALLTPNPPAGETQPVANGPAAHWRAYSTLPSRLHHNHHNNSGSSMGGAERLGLGEIRDLINLEMPQLNEALVSNRSNTQLGWACPSCTFINKPTRPGCEMCSADRPEGYTVPGGYRPDALELRRIQQEKEAIRQYQQEKGRREELRASNSLQYNLNQDY